MLWQLWIRLSKQRNWQCRRAGAPLPPLLRNTEVLRKGSEVVFYRMVRGAVTIRDNGGMLCAGLTRKVETNSGGSLDLTITEQFARSMSMEDALNRANLLCYEMNSQTLPPEHRFPVRLIAPGWYGVANAKWLTRVEAIDHHHAGRMMARDYLTILEEQRDGQTVRTFTTVGPVQLKSAPERVTRRNGLYAVTGQRGGADLGSSGPGRQRTVAGNDAARQPRDARCHTGRHAQRLWMAEKRIPWLRLAVLEVQPGRGHLGKAHCSVTCD